MCTKRYTLKFFDGYIEHGMKFYGHPSREQIKEFLVDALFNENVIDSIIQQIYDKRYWEVKRDGIHWWVRLEVVCSEHQ